ncbi:Snf7-domain-containing protein [Umbelopsis sp. PMI_123]|nr:Snf7-domain-containing protein [Umbelopsis sp. PMI_123]
MRVSVQGFGLYSNIMGASASKNKITDQDKAILDLKVQRDKLKQYQKKLQIVTDKEVQIAKQCLAQGNKKKALISLKKKKYQEQLLEKTDAQLMNLEELTNSIEFAVVEKQVLDGLQKGNEVLKEIHKEMSVEAVQKLMDDTADAIEYQNEIDEILSGKITAEDEEDVLRELEELQQQELEAQMPAVPDKVPAGMEHTEEEEQELPSVPSHNPLEGRSATTKAVRQAENKQGEGMLLA